MPWKAVNQLVFIKSVKQLSNPLPSPIYQDGTGSAHLKLARAEINSIRVSQPWVQQDKSVLAPSLCNTEVTGGREGVGEGRLNST